MGEIKGYKVFNSDWTCRGFQYEVGKKYKHNGDISMCNAGFHFCRKLADCFNYYSFDSSNKVAEVIATGNVETDNDDKSVTDEITIVREISWSKVLDLCNSGHNCTGNRNTGNRNTGDWNTGNWNTGNRNTGNWNTGNCNTGNCNTGNWNTGNRNTGDWNTGDWNTGDCNTGNWNSTSFSTGLFNSIAQPLYLFDKPTELSRNSILNIKGIQVLNWNYENNWWIYSNNMSNVEKAQHPEHEYTGGYLKTVDFKTACKMMWNNISEDDKQAVREIPNFDVNVFKNITGIEV